MRLATPLYNMEAGAKSTVELRSNDEREHRGTEVDAPHRSWPPWSFLIIETKRSPCISSTRTYWCRVWHPAPQRAREKAEQTFDLGSGRHVERA